MKTCTLLLAASIAACAHSQQPPTSADTAATCPVAITGINPSGADSFGRAFLRNTGNAHANDGRMFVLRARNDSGKDIRGMKFQAAYFDATEDTTDIPISWEWTDPLKASAEKSFRWENAWREESKVGWRVRLVKVLYEDGTKWEAPDASACRADYWRDKHHRS